MHGKLGTGKSKFSVYVMRQALAFNRRIACNFPVDIGKLLPAFHRISYVELPARPKLRDLEALGHGNPESYDEEKNGVLVLDELAVWLNSRNFQEKDRADVLHWLVHSRKFGWDVYFLCQNPMQIDRQVRESLLEYSVRMKALDKVRLPMIGYGLQLLGMRGTYPRGTHSAVIKLGFDQQSPLVDRIIFKGTDLHECYDTRHVFAEDSQAVAVTHLGPRYFIPLPVRLTRWQRLRAVLGLGVGQPAFRAGPSAPRSWPESVSRLPADARWQIARRLFASGGPA